MSRKVTRYGVRRDGKWPHIHISATKQPTWEDAPASVSTRKRSAQRTASLVNGEACAIEDHRPKCADCCAPVPGHEPDCQFGSKQEVPDGPAE